MTDEKPFLEPPAGKRRFTLPGGKTGFVTRDPDYYIQHPERLHHMQQEYIRCGGHFRPDYYEGGIADAPVGFYCLANIQGEDRIALLFSFWPETFESDIPKFTANSSFYVVNTYPNDIELFDTKIWTDMNVHSARMQWKPVELNIFHIVENDKHSYRNPMVSYKLEAIADSDKFKVVKYVKHYNNPYLLSVNEEPELSRFFCDFANPPHVVPGEFTFDEARHFVRCDFFAHLHALTHDIRPEDSENLANRMHRRFKRTGQDLVHFGQHLPTPRDVIKEISYRNAGARIMWGAALLNPFIVLGGLAAEPLRIMVKSLALGVERAAFPESIASYVKPRRWRTYLDDVLNPPLDPGQFRVIHGQGNLLRPLNSKIHPPQSDLHKFLALLRGYHRGSYAGLVEMSEGKLFVSHPCGLKSIYLRSAIHGTETNEIYFDFDPGMAVPHPGVRPLPQDCVELFNDGRLIRMTDTADWENAGSISNYRALTGAIRHERPRVYPMAAPKA